MNGYRWLRSVIADDMWNVHLDLDQKIACCDVCRLAGFFLIESSFKYDDDSACAMVMIRSSGARRPYKPYNLYAIGAIHPIGAPI